MTPVFHKKIFKSEKFENSEQNNKSYSKQIHLQNMYGLFISKDDDDPPHKTFVVNPVSYQGQ